MALLVDLTLRSVAIEAVSEQTHLLSQQAQQGALELLCCNLEGQRFHRFIKGFL
jgi:hypothetical protein